MARRRTANKLLFGRRFASKLAEVEHGVKGLADTWGHGSFYAHDDPNGSYTGTPTDVGELPVQDADDL